MYILDGIEYASKEDAPDIGGWYHNPPYIGKKREYSGISTEINKLPKYVSTGSTAYCIDTGDIYIYYAGDKSWHKQ